MCIRDRQELDRLKNSTGDTAEEQEKLQNEITELSAALEASEAKEQAAARGVSAVSYTHLDVYKRQHLRHGLPAVVCRCLWR